MPSNKMSAKKKVVARPQRQAVAPPRPRQAPRPLPKAPPARPPPKVESPLRAYELAVCNPFSDAAQGARLPGVYSFPTVTRRLKATFTVYADSTGLLNAMCYPHPNVTITQLTQNVPTAIAGPVVGGWSVVPASTGQAPVNLGGNCQWAGFTTPASVANTVGSWRIVGGGVRIIPTGNFTNTQGIITVAPVPLKGELAINSNTGTTINLQSVTDTAHTNATDLAVAYQYPTVPLSNSNVVAMSTLDSLPDSRQVSFGKLLENGGLEIPFRPVGPEIENFHSPNYAGLTNTPGTVTIQTGEAYQPGTNNTQNLVGSYQSLGSGSVAGWTGVAMYGTGLAANAAVDVEVLLHMEGEPLVVTAATAASGATLSEVGQLAPRVTRETVDKLLMRALNSQAVREIGAAMGKATLRALMPAI